ncbi:MAG TPA: RNA pseudouridine synthase [Leucothrix mucor]|nr:RNA pseudouridine synthase [Leucothrix mucor]
MVLIVNNHIEEHISAVSDGQSAVDLLCEKTNLSKQRIKLAMKNGAVWIERGTQKVQRLRRAKQIIKSGEIVHIYYDEKLITTPAVASELMYDRSAYSIWYKPQGILSQGSKWGDHHTINRWAEQNLQPQRPAFIVHRLDKAACGLMILAHKKKTAAQFSNLFENRQIEKHYQVIVRGTFPKETQTITTDIDERSAISHAKLLSYNKEKNRSLVDVNIESGRKHQIRKHLQELGFPVIGDRLYGNKDDTEDLQLASFSLSFICPVTQEQKHYTLPENKQLTL